MLKEIEQERRTRARADTEAEAARHKLAEVESAARAQAVQHAAKATRLEIDASQAKLVLDAATNARDGLSRQVTELQQQLADSQQAVSRHRAEAQTLQALLERLTPAPDAGTTNGRTVRRKAGSADT